MNSCLDHSPTRPSSAEHKISSSVDPTVFLNIRERKPTTRISETNVPLLLVHGATISSVLWDNPLSGWSWMDRLANDGAHVFAIDLRGYGRSSRPDCFEKPAQDTAPYARAQNVMGDVIDAIHFIKERTGSSHVDLLGGSWGSIICGKLVAEVAEIGVRKLVLYAPLYSEPASRPAWLNYSGSPASLNEKSTAIGAYRQVSIADLKTRWDNEIPLENKSLWRPDGVFEALADSSVHDDAQFSWADTNSFRTPTGTIADLLDIYDGTPLYNCRKITVPTLLIRGAADPVSTHEDASRLFELLGSNTKRYTVIGNGAHFMIGENKLPEVHASVLGFLSEDFSD